MGTARNRQVEGLGTQPACRHRVHIVAFLDREPAGCRRPKRPLPLFSSWRIPSDGAQELNQPVFRERLEVGGKGAHLERSAAGPAQRNPHAFKLVPCLAQTALLVLGHVEGKGEQQLLQRRPPRTEAFEYDALVRCVLVEEEEPPGKLEEEKYSEDLT